MKNEFQRRAVRPPVVCWLVLVSVGQCWTVMGNLVGALYEIII